MRKILVIFDLDGTLYRTETSFIPAVKELLTQYGLSCPEEEFLFSFTGEPTYKFTGWLKTLNFKDDLKTVLRKVDSLEIKYVGERGCVYPNAIETLEWLKERNCRMALCSNGRARYVCQILDKFGLHKYFEIVRYPEDNEETKSDMVRKIIVSLNAKKAFVVGDRYHDIISAKDNSCVSIGANYGYGKGEIKGADYIVNDISEIRDIIASYY